MYTKDWLIQRTRFYQKMGFFEDYIDLSDEELVNRLISLKQEATGVGDERVDDLFTEGYDCSILNLDTKRVLTAATDILYGDEPPSYDFEILVETIAKLAAISRGAFLPQDLREIDPETIEFSLNGQHLTLIVDSPPDDPLILAGQINPVILDSGYQFNQWDLSPDVWIIALTEREERELEELGWRFLPDRWMFDEFGD